jgi:hypothetical protein
MSRLSQRDSRSLIPPAASIMVGDKQRTAVAMSLIRGTMSLIRGTRQTAAASVSNRMSGF